MGLFFRSLVSSPAHAAAAAHAGLKEVLDLNEKRGGEGGAGGAGGEGGDAPVIFGLPQDTLQQCLRPILTRLNDYKQLSLSLTEGLAKLLGLLSSRFNKTFGDKLLDHLHHWLDPAALTNLKIWRAGEEPLVAASVINLFELLPQGTAFVERLVTTVINLESTLHQFKGYNQAHSPYRLPLTRYLTQYVQRGGVGERSEAGWACAARRACCWCWLAFRSGACCCCPVFLARAAGVGWRFWRVLLLPSVSSACCCCPAFLARLLLPSVSRACCCCNVVSGACCCGPLFLERAAAAARRFWRCRFWRCRFWRS
jgi:hypothetical protein